MKPQLAIKPQPAEETLSRDKIQAIGIAKERIKAAAAGCPFSEEDIVLSQLIMALKKEKTPTLLKDIYDSIVRHLREKEQELAQVFFRRASPLTPSPALTPNGHFKIPALFEQSFEEILESAYLFQIKDTKEDAINSAVGCVIMGEIDETAIIPSLCREVEEKVIELLVEEDHPGRSQTAVRQRVFELVKLADDDLQPLAQAAAGTATQAAAEATADTAFDNAVAQAILFIRDDIAHGNGECSEVKKTRLQSAQKITNWLRVIKA